MRILARKLLDINPVDLGNWITGSFTLVFDDGEMDTNAKETIISSFFWDYHRQYKDLDLLREHHIGYYLKGKRLKNKTHLSLVGAISKEWYKKYEDRSSKEERIKMLRIGYETTNNYYNQLLSMTSDYVTTIDMTDLIGVVTHEKIKEIKEKGDYSQQGIKDIHKKITDLITKDQSFKDNNISKLLKSGLIKDTQMVQCIGPYGYPKDIDDYIFRRPIKRGYIEGFRNFYDSLTESRSASTSLHLAKSYLSDVEYFSRKAQLVGMNLANIHRGDCGSNNYIPWEVRNKSDLNQLYGIFYLDKDKIEKMVTPQDEHLIGKILKIRSVYGCIHPDPNGVCERCYGKLGRNVIDGTVVGQQSGVTMASDNSQNVLSTKHIISSGVAAKIVMKDNQAKFFTQSPDGMGYMLNPNLNKKGLKMTLSQKSIITTSFLEIGDLSNIYSSRITDVSQVKIRYLLGEEYREEVVTLESQARRAYATKSFLEYMRNNPWEVDSRNNYEIDLSNWDNELIMFKCPPKQFSTVDFSKGISSILEAKVSEQKDRDNKSPVEFLKEFHEYYTQTRDLPLSVLMAITYGYTIVSKETNDFSLPKPHTKKGVGVMKHIMANRSLGAAMAYETQNDLLINPNTFLQTNRLDHVFDYMLLPQMVKRYKRK